MPRRHRMADQRRCGARAVTSCQFPGTPSVKLSVAEANAVRLLQDGVRLLALIIRDNGGREAAPIGRPNGPRRGSRTPAGPSRIPVPGWVYVWPAAMGSASPSSPGAACTPAPTARRGRSPRWKASCRAPGLVRGRRDTEVVDRNRAVRRQAEHWPVGIDREPAGPSPGGRRPGWHGPGTGSARPSRWDGTNSRGADGTQRRLELVD